MTVKTLVDIFQNRSKSVGITFIENSDKEFFLSYQDLYDQALSILDLLRKSGIEKGNELVFQVSDNVTFVKVFWACILGGIIPVPLVQSRIYDHFLKLYNVIKVLNHPFLITSSHHLDKYNEFIQTHNLDNFKKPGIILENLLDNLVASDNIQINVPDENELAYVQFSSGSTGTPKGVRLTHKNLITNSNAIIKGICPPKEGDRFFTWMPLSHDMGLIGFHITPLVAGWAHYIMPTELFIRRPFLWFEKISQHKITFTASPNFGYRYLLNRLGKNVLNNIDLSSIRMIANGAEPISSELCSEFLEKFNPIGLHKNGILPVYGLAEASLAVTFTNPREQITTIYLDRSSLKSGNKIKQNSNGKGIGVVNVGKPLDNCFVRISSNGKKPAKDNIIGNIEIKGDNVTGGYYNNIDETKKVLREDGWLDTGDLGFIRKGNLYITGRAKDIIFINGENFYPHDIERSLETIEGIELEKIAVSSYFNNDLRKEEIIVFVLHKGKLEEFRRLSETIKSKINFVFGFAADKVLPIREMPKTSSGKLQRYKLIEQYISGKFSEVENELRLAFSKDTSNLTISPKDEFEKNIFIIWSEVLKKKNFGVNSNFFEIGGDSLKAALILSKIYDLTKIELNFELFFEKPTIDEIAKELKLRKSNDKPIIHTPIDTQYCNLSSSQKRIYYFWKLNSNSTAYNIPIAVQIKGKLDLRKLEKSINQLIIRHQALRLFFVEKNTISYQCLNKKNVFKLKCSDIKESEINKALVEKVQPFDITKAPLFRIELLRINDSMHILFTDFHHIISDGFSVSKFYEELMLLYQGETLLPIKAQFRDFVYWEKKLKNSRDYHKQEKFWVSQFKNEVPELNFSLDFVRPLVQNYKGEKLEFYINKDITARLKKLSNENKVSLFMALLSTYTILLSKFTSQEDLVVGTPMLNRKNSHFHETMGMFVNNLALRVFPSGEKKFDDYLLEIKKLTLNAFDNQQYSFDDLIDKIKIERVSNRSLLFDTMFILQKFELPVIDGIGFSMERYFFDPGFSKYDLTMEVFDEGEMLKLYIEYSTQIFKRETIIRFSECFMNILKQVLEAPGKKIMDISILNQSDYDRIVTSLNQTFTDERSDNSVYQLFENIAKTFATEIAVIDNSEKLSYQEISLRVTQLAQLIQKRGISQNTPVILILERSVGLIVSILATLKAGGCYIPIDVDLPEKRIKYIIDDSKAQLIITSKILCQKKKSLLEKYTSDHIILIDDAEQYQITSAPIVNKLSSSDLVYIIYTSGTTGNPKGVMIENKALVNYVTWAIKTYNDGKKLNFPLFTSVSFDLTVTSIFVPLLTGGTIHIYRDEYQRHSLELALKDNQVDIIKLTPSHLKLITDNSNLILIARNSKIKKMIVGGENLTVQLSKNIYELFNHQIEIFNEYGPTEATVGCMIYKYDPVRDMDLSVPIGKPIDNTQIYLLDKYLKPVSEGIVGEIYISGDCLARNYFTSLPTDEEKFIPNPFIPCKRMYKTGDLAIRLQDDNLEFKGRKDHQIKIRGHRIELAEIESLLKGHPKMKQAVVVVKINCEGENALLAYYILKNKSIKITSAEIKKYLLNKLPFYMVPEAYVPINELPLNKSGKINYNALPEPKRNIKTQFQTKYRNTTEELITQVWKDVLNSDKIDIDSNFYELGGDSIKAIQIASRLYDKAIVLNAKDILTYQTIRQISTLAKSALTKTRKREKLLIGKKDLSPIEEWFIRQKFYNQNYYNQSVLLEFKKNIDSLSLEKAFVALIEHHDGLRLNYETKEKKLFYNNALLNENFTIEEINLSKSYAKQGLIQIGKKLKSSINLKQELPLKAILIYEKDLFPKLLIVAHHLLIDGISWRILLTDLFSSYNSLIKNVPIQLPAKTASLKDWHKHLKFLSRTLQLKNEIPYWKKIENGIFTIPKDYQYFQLKVKNVNTLHKVLDKNSTVFFLKQAHIPYRTDSEILLVASLVKSLHDWTKSKEIIVEIENHGRIDKDINVSRTLGWFTSMFPVQFTIESSELGEIIKSVKESVRTVPQNGIGYGILKYMNNALSLSLKISEVRMNYLGQFDHEVNNDLFNYSFEDTGSDIDPHNHVTAYIDINCMVVKDQLHINVSYSSEVYKKTTIEHFLNNYIQNLTDILNFLKSENEIHFTPSDFDAIELDNEDLKVLFDA